jgi:hypothetical protein
MSGVASWSFSLSVSLLLPAWLFSGDVFAQSGAHAGLLKELKILAEAYRIKIVTSAPELPVETTHGTVDGKEGDRRKIQDYAGLFVQEFSLYPKDLVRRTQLRRVVLCGDLSFAGQRRNAVPDYEHDTLYLDIDRGSYSRSYQRKVIHHEFFHIIDYHDDGSVYEDGRWAALNPADFRYGRGGRESQNLPQTSVLTTEFPGFLNPYSTTGVEEDKAELFANLLVDPAHVEARARMDRVLGAKVERMKKLLVGFSPEMDARFWAKIQKLGRTGR